MDEVHYVLLYNKHGVREWVNRPTEAELCEHMIQLCEEEHIHKVKSQAEAFGRVVPDVVEYDAADLLNFYDFKLSEVTVLKFDVATHKYEPRGSSWFKSRVYEYLQSHVEAETSQKGDE